MKAKKTEQKDYAKRGKNPTTNYPRDVHGEFCRRCLAAHYGSCPNGNMNSCSL